jgi:arylsulfatase A-like enzyme
MDVVRDLYLAEVASVDQVIRELFDGLTARGVLPHAVVIVTADHGEEFYEHGHLGHGNDLFNETLRVPLLLVAPGVTPGVLDGDVSLLDVAPGILALAGAPAEPRFEGRALGRTLQAAPVYAELLSTAQGKEPEQNRGLVAGNDKLLVTPAGGEQFYDLARDPGEMDPNALDATARTTLQQLLDTMRARAQRDVGTAQQRELDEATRDRLRALGYTK